MRTNGGVCSGGVSAWSWGGLPGPGVCLVWGVSAWSRGGLPGLGGCLPGPRGPAWSGGVVVSAPGGGLPGPGGVLPSGDPPL